MECSVCKKKLATTFLGKLIGAYVKKDGKLLPVCRECQKKLITKDKILASVA